MLIACQERKWEVLRVLRNSRREIRVLLRIVKTWAGRYISIHLAGRGKLLKKYTASPDKENGI